MAFQFCHNGSMLISGPSGCSKSYFIKNFLKNIDVMADVKFAQKIVYYAEWQPTYLEYGSDVEFREGLPQSEDFLNDNKPKLVIIDDQMREEKGSVTDIFTKWGHHRNISVIFITQNLFQQGQRTISLNSHYIVIFKNPRDQAQISHLARQMFPHNPRFLQEAYTDATFVPHGYLLLDLKQKTPEWRKVRANIFPTDDYHYVYIPKSIKGQRDNLGAPVVYL